ncbi:hypothetical protein PC116_g33435 [Phytophthora cactorum]|nr:hypothetical protein PC116_g33435 [Phytophthora cactorum]
MRPTGVVMESSSTGAREGRREARDCDRGPWAAAPTGPAR